MVPRSACISGSRTNAHREQMRHARQTASEPRARRTGTSHTQNHHFTILACFVQLSVEYGINFMETSAKGNIVSRWVCVATASCKACLLECRRSVSQSCQRYQSEDRQKSGTHRLLASSRMSLDLLRALIRRVLVFYRVVVSDPKWIQRRSPAPRSGHVVHSSNRNLVTIVVRSFVFFTLIWLSSRCLWNKIKHTYASVDDDCWLPKWWGRKWTNRRITQFTLWLIASIWNPVSSSSSLSRCPDAYLPPPPRYRRRRRHRRSSSSSSTSFPIVDVEAKSFDQIYKCVLLRNLACAIVFSMYTKGKAKK